MIRRPQFKNHLRLEPVADDLAFLLSERASFALEGPLLCAIARHIDGKRTFDDLVGLLGGQANVLDVQYGLSILEEKGYIFDAESVPEQGRVYRLRIKEFGTAIAEDFQSVLARTGLKVSDQADFCVALTDDYRHAGMGDLNRRALSRGLAWMLVKPIGAEIWIGPLFQPGRTACWECLVQRLSRNLRVHSFIRRKKNLGQNPAVVGPTLPSMSMTALGIASNEALRWLQGTAEHPLQGRLWSLDSRTLESRFHAVVRCPNCPACGRADNRTSPEFRSLPFSGDHLTPQETLNALDHHVSPMVGIVPRIEKVSQPDDVVEVWAAPNPAARDEDEWCRMKESLRGRCVGKGFTPEEARRGALCEALERYSGVFRGDERRVKSCYQSLGEQAIHPNNCLNFSARQYREREIWNRRESHSNWVPEPFDERAEIEWTPLWSFTHQRFRYLPTDYLYYRVESSVDRSRFFRPDSNGCAAGSSLDDAILRGFLELVERDCVAIWWYNSAPRPVVDLGSFEHHDFSRLLDWYLNRNRSIDVFDVTNDFQIPAFAAVSRLEGGSRADLLLGFGAHLDAATAIRGALFELSQSLAASSLSSTSRQAIHAFDVSKLDESFLRAHSDLRRKRGDYTPPDRRSIAGQLSECVRRVESIGLELLVLDQTREDTGLPVVKVVVPGMRQHWARFREGRLFEVPVELGWSKKARRERDLNPSHLFL